MSSKLIDRIQKLVEESRASEKRIAVLRDRRKNLVSQLKNASGKTTIEEAKVVAEQLKTKASNMEKQLEMKLAAIEEQVYEEEE